VYLSGLINNTPDRFITISLELAFHRCWAGKSKRLKALSCRCRQQSVRSID
jgi:hypothetical protein